MKPGIPRKGLQLVRNFLVCVLATASITSSAAVVGVGTDATWLATNSAPAAGWNTNASFNTSTWVNATVNIPSCQTASDCIWFDGQFSATADAWFRKTFSLTDPVSSAFLSGGVDDDADIFINGTQVFNNHDGFAGNFGPFDVTSLLIVGTNLIAVHATDNIAQFGQNHTYVSLLTVNTRVASVPVPGVLSLVLIGLVGLFTARRKSGES